MLGTNQFKNGNHIDVDGTVFKILDFQHVKPGKGGAFVRTKLRRASDGNVIDRTFRAGEKFRSVQDGGAQDAVPVRRRHRRALHGHRVLRADRASPKARVTGRAALDQSRAARWTCCSSTTSPPTCSCRARSTWRSPRPTRVCAATASRGAARSRRRSRPARRIQVPLFVEVGERIRVDTRSGEYVSRA